MPRRAHPDTESYLLGARRTALRHADSWSGVATTEEEIADLAPDLQGRLGSGALRTDERPVVLVLESFEGLTGSTVESIVDSLVKVALEHDVLVVAEAETSAVSTSYLLGTTLKQARRGLALQPDDVDGPANFRQAFPRSTRSEYPVGRGMVVDSGRAARVQIGLPT